MKPEDLDQDIILRTYKELNSGASDGYGKTYTSFNTKHTSTTINIQKNIFLFSAAKSFEQLTEMNDQLVDDQGKLRNFKAFRAEVEKVHKKYNQNYLQAEHQTARASAQMIRKWGEFQEQKEIYPNLIYKTVGDSHVRDAHSKLNGIIKPIDDPFWDSHYPPNGFRCRCTVRSTDEPAETGNIRIKIDKGFNQNVGKTNQVFDQKKHPYFAQSRSDQSKTLKSFELSKKYAPLTTRFKAPNGAKVKVSPFTDNRSDELSGNFKTAVLLARKMKVDVDMVAHIDAAIIPQKNPEYVIDKKIADRKAPESLNYNNSFKKAAKQGCEVVVIDLSKNNDTIENAEQKIDRILSKKNVHKNIKEVYIVSANRKTVKLYKRKKQS